MKIGSIGALFVWLMTFGFPFIVRAQDLGAGFTKVKDGIYVFAPDATTTTCSFVVTQEGVVMIDSCNSPLDSRKMLAAVKKKLPTSQLSTRRRTVIKMPEYADWHGQDRLGVNNAVVYKSVKK